MHDLLRESFFGRLLHLASGGKLFQTPEQIDPSLLDRYMPAGFHSPSEKTLAPSTQQNTGSPPSPTSEKHEGANRWYDPPFGKLDAEKGKDHQLVDWLENDPEVRYRNVHTSFVI